MNKKVLLSLLLVGNFAFAQKQKFTMEEATMGIYTSLSPKRTWNFNWLDDQHYTEAVRGAYLKTNIQTMKKDTLISLHQLNKNLAKENRFNYLPQLKFINENKAYFNHQSQYFWLEKIGNAWGSSNWTNLEQGAENVHLLSDHSGFVYTIKNNLFINKNGKNIAITQDSNENIINGQAVHRNEFGINGGIFIAPDNQKIAFYRMDQTMVEDYPIIDWSGNPAMNKNVKYPMAGRKSHEVTLGIYDVKSNSTKFLNIEGDKEQYLTAISWSPDAKFIFVGVLNRGQNHLKFNQYDAQSGNFIKTLFEEKSDKYVEPQHAITFLPNSNTDFIWQSQRTGYNHLFHYNINKGLVKQITKGDWLVTKLLGFNANKSEIYFESTKESPMERHLYRVNWKSTKMEKLSKGSGTHRGVLNPKGTLLFDAYSANEVPRVENIINTSNLKETNLLTAENTLIKYDRPAVKEVTLKADDGTPLYGKLITPTDLDVNKKYPVIVYLYNGPHAQLVTNDFPASTGLWYEYMAQRGYVVFIMDGRGSSNRGMKFEQAVFRQLGEVEMSDQMKGVEYLKSLSFVDSERMGIHGWSFGGFMTTNFMLKKPDVFKVGVAGGPVMDWHLYEIMYTERYMDSPQENPEGYAKTKLIDKVQNLKGKLLVIHGTQDDVVTWQHSVDFVRSAVEKGVQMDYFIYPGHAHNVYGKDRVHLMQKITDYFDLYLKK